MSFGFRRGRWRELALMSPLLTKLETSAIATQHLSAHGERGRSPGGLKTADGGSSPPADPAVERLRPVALKPDEAALARAGLQPVRWVDKRDIVRFDQGPPIYAKMLEDGSLFYSEKPWLGPERRSTPLTVSEVNHEAGTITYTHEADE